MNTKKIIHIVYDNAKTLIIVTNSYFNQVTFIPTFLYSFFIYGNDFTCWDRIFVSKYSYGYSKHSFPFSPNISNQRFFQTPKRGDLVVFKTPSDNRTDYIKRLIECSDTVQFIEGNY